MGFFIDKGTFIHEKNNTPNQLKMKLFTAAQIKKWDEYTIKNQPITSSELMERAGNVCTNRIVELIKEKEISQVKVICGSGNNGGDGYVIARKLFMQGILVSVYAIASDRKTTIDNERNYFRIIHETGMHVHAISNESQLPTITENDLVVDAILGLGLTNEIQGIHATVINHINNSKGYVVAIDIPSGLPADLISTPSVLPAVIVRANTTLTFQIPKQFFLLADAFPYTGNFEVLDIGLLHDFQDEEPCDVHYITPENTLKSIKKRHKFSNKGTYGHLLLIAGSYGKMGAAVLSAKGAMRAGCGLLTAYIPSAGNVIMQTALPEAMVESNNDDKLFTTFPDLLLADAIAIGPGMGTNQLTNIALMSWLSKVNKPIVIDADGLNIIAENIQQGQAITFPPETVITPHPKEFDRLAGVSTSVIERVQKQVAFAKKYQVTVLLKGAHTSIATPQGEVYFNSTGNPVLATAGSGDVLTGIIGSFLAQGYSPLESALLGAYLHGACGDKWLELGNKTMLASDIAALLPTII